MDVGSSVVTAGRRGVKGTEWYWKKYNKSYILKTPSKDGLTVQCNEKCFENFPKDDSFRIKNE